MSSNQDYQTALPIKRDITLIYASSFLVAILMTTVSVAGLLYRTTIYPTEELLQAFVPNDIVNLFVGLPILLGSIWLTWRGRLVGLLCWPGALFFVLYNYIVYAFASPLNWAFLFYITLVTLSVYSLISLVASIEGKAVHQRLTGVVSERFAGGVLVGFGLLFFLRVIGVIANAIANGALIAEAELATNSSDFFIAPAWFIGGILLWRRKEFGYVAGLGLLFQASMLFIALIVFLLLQPFLTTAPFAITDIIVVFTMGLICFVPFALFARGVVTKRA
jgi:hypothetical protein